MNHHIHRNKNRKTGICALVASSALALLVIGVDAAPVDPASVPGMVLRLDASAITGLTNGQDVAVWSDLSGNGFDATQSGISQPTYLTNQLAGQPAVHFDGTYDFMTNAAFVSGAQTWFVVYQNDTPPVGNGMTVISLANPGGTTNYSEVGLVNFAGYQNVSLAIDYPQTFTTAVGFNPTLDLQSHVLGFTYNGSGTTVPGNYQIGYDQTNQTVVASSTLGRNDALGAIGWRPSTLPFAGNMGEILIYNSVLSAADYNGIQEYLYFKWIPEPSATLLLGLGGLLLWRRKR